MHALTEPGQSFRGFLVTVLFTGGVIALALAFTPLPGQHLAREELTGPATAIDGDTLRIQSRRIRLAAIDAPEADQRCTDARGARYDCGDLAAVVLGRLLAGELVHCVRVDTDRYGRMVAACDIGGADLAEVMVRAGLAIRYARYDRAGRYLDAEAEARAARRGIWQGPFTEPEIWRARRSPQGEDGRHAK